MVRWLVETADEGVTLSSVSELPYSVMDCILENTTNSFTSAAHAVNTSCKHTKSWAPSLSNPDNYRCEVDKDGDYVPVILNENYDYDTESNRPSKPKMFIPDDIMWKMFRQYCEKGYLLHVQILVGKYHMPVNAPSPTSSPLYISMDNNKFCVAQYLINAGADPFVRHYRTESWTMLDIAKRHILYSGNINELLVKKGLSDHEGISHHYESCNAECVSELVEVLEKLGVKEEYQEISTDYSEESIWYNY